MPLLSPELPRASAIRTEIALAPPALRSVAVPDWSLTAIRPSAAPAVKPVGDVGDVGGGGGGGVAYDDADDTEDESEDEPPPAFEPLSRSQARKAAKLAAAKKKEAERKALEAECRAVLGDMTTADKDSYADAILADRSLAQKQILVLLQKARSNWLYPMIKSKLRTSAPDLVPVTDDPAADGDVYEASKKAFEDAPYQYKWPRWCWLLFGRDEDEEAQFYYTERGASATGDKPTPFVKFVHEMAKECEIDTIKPGFIAWLACV